MSFKTNKTNIPWFSKDGHTDRFKIVKDVKRYTQNMRPTRLAISFVFVFLMYSYIVDHVLHVPSKSRRGVFDSEEVSLSFRSRNIKQIDELNKIKNSINVELRDLENKRNKMQEDISRQHKSLGNVEQNIKKGQGEVEGLQRELTQLKNEKFEALAPKVAAPARLVATSDDSVELLPPVSNKGCTMYNCFDYSRCSLYSQFPVYVYDIDADGAEPLQRTPFIADVSNLIFAKSAYITDNPEAACLYVVVVGEMEIGQQANNGEEVHRAATAAWLRSLAYWRGDGRNHMIVYLSKRSTAQNPLLGVDTGRAVLAQSNFVHNQYRAGFDVVIPALTTGRKQGGTDENERLQMSPDANWLKEDISPMVPAVRNYFLTFEGEWSDMGEAAPLVRNLQERDDEKKFLLEEESEFHAVFMSSLTTFRDSQIGGKYLFRLRCSEDRIITHGYRSEWSLCGSSASRKILLSRSTFALVTPAERHDAFTSTTLFSVRLTEALSSGAIPVVIGTHVRLPFSEFIDWNKAAVIVPQARVTELPFLLSSFPHAEILAMRLQGRFLYETYLASPQQVAKSILAVVRSKLQIPPLPVEDVPGKVIDHKSYKINKETSPGDAQSEFGMPPLEDKMPSATFIRNYTMTTVDARASWNSIPGPFRLYPFTPSDRTVSSDAQFIGSSNGFRPIGGGEGGFGKQYQENLGGNTIREQFTVVMLTYEREEVLMKAVQHLKGIPHLNKLLVVWNSPSDPDDTLQWPDIGVPVEVIRTRRNSLNNRFIPYEQIETEAVLSIDDDAHLRHDEILFGFRVWRESRDQIVGFPGRFHAWNSRDNKWNYNSNHTCELSMVLTGAAFVHKYYMYLYTYWMPAEIRETVDEFINCEDIAINFLVSHVTRKPPVKVTSRWTFRCDGCPDALSQSDEHFHERHECINRFQKAFGYMPLVYTQHRADSILFKTRLPHDKQKCFRYV